MLLKVKLHIKIPTRKFKYNNQTCYQLTHKKIKIVTLKGSKLYNRKGFRKCL